MFKFGNLVQVATFDGSRVLGIVEDAPESDGYYNVSILDGAGEIAAIVHRDRLSLVAHHSPYHVDGDVCARAAYHRDCPRNHRYA